MFALILLYVWFYVVCQVLVATEDVFKAFCWPLVLFRLTDLITNSLLLENTNE